VFFLLSKLLIFVISPVFWLLLLLIGAAATRRPLRRSWLLGGSLLLALVGTNPYLADAAFRAWEMPPAPQVSHVLSDAGILLTGLGDGRYQPLPRLTQVLPTVSRAAGALHLYRTGRIRRIIISGGSGELAGVGRLSEARHLAHLLEAAGVPPTVILLEERSRNTHENAVFTRQLLTAQPSIRTLTLITSAYHQRRALACFQQVGLQPAVFSTDFQPAALSASRAAQWWPSIGALRRWHVLLREIAGYCIYKALGYC
jgi:uncharacterized SAM-binding protein YcdF (DUF218 family)